LKSGIKTAPEEIRLQEEAGPAVTVIDDFDAFLITVACANGITFL
jgi:hypothetical protein